MDINDLKEKLIQLGVDEDKIDSVIATVLGFVKDKLPDNISGLVDGVISGEGGMPDLGDALGKVGGLFGGK